MAYLQFNKQELGNLEYSLKHEFLATNRTGGYLSTTIVGCNIRKYHGLLVVPIDQLGGDNYVLLSALDETVIQHQQEFNLGIHRYPGVYEPRGHKYIIDFEMDRNIVITYRVGGVILQKEILFCHNKDQVLLRYTLLEAHSPTTLRLKPFLAFRNAHSLTHANMDANMFHSVEANGIGCCLYKNFPTLYMQLNVQNEFVSFPDWYKNIEYTQETARGYESHEDLFVPGFFEFKIRKGQSIVFSASTSAMKPAQLKSLFDKELSIRPSRDSFVDCLKLAASQCIIKRGKDTEIVAGYPWFGRWGRETFIALPGLTLAANKDVESCKAVIDTMVRDVRGGLFPKMGEDGQLYLTTADAPLWLFWTLQQYLKETGNPAAIWEDYGSTLKSILRTYKNGTANVRMHANGLIWAEQSGVPLTWMDVVVDGVPITQRQGYAVEVCALWYNAVCFALELARACEDKEFVEEFAVIPKRVEESFYPMFWVEQRKHLADFVGPSGQNVFTRPNQLIACSMPYSPIDDEVKNKILEVCARELLTPKGLRTLSPKNPLFMGVYEGDHRTRDYAYHQGTVRPWLVGQMIDATLRIHGKAFLERAKEMVYAFEEDIAEHGVGSIPELYDANPPYHLHGCISNACSVAAILRSLKLIEEYEQM